MFNRCTDTISRGLRAPEGGDITRTIVDEPLDGARQAVHAPAPVLDGGDHQITYPPRLRSRPWSRPSSWSRGHSNPGRRQRDPLDVLASNLDAIRAPAQVRGGDRDPPVMMPLDPNWMAMKRQA